ncbi:BtpA/SgcQ family protein [Knoellia sp. S7-12]|uniref:BtpA/SgcQ family protein n=1 Tax=Knoellia sp. S7-12 TaxID=3126698 RepID=UPI0033670A66
MWNDLFAVDKPIIGMCHLPALPGDPHYSSRQGMRDIVDYARREVLALQEGGIDAILISNEFSLPYLTKTEPITAAAMARIIGEVMTDITVPFGVNVLWDGRASIDLAVATGASFVREIFTGVYASDFGIWDTNIGEVARHRSRVGAEDVRMLFNIVPEAATYLASRDLAAIAKSTVFNARPDGLCVSGLTAGATTDTDSLRTVKEAVPGTPVVVNTGVKDTTIADLLSVADAAIVGTFLKRDGLFANPVDPKRVEKLMAAVSRARTPASPVPVGKVG